VDWACKQGLPLAWRTTSAAIQGRETTNEDSNIKAWVEDQLIPNTVLIDQAGYTQMCIDALKTTSTQVLSNFGTSQQRDFGQAWADTIRGYLGELAVVLFLRREFGIETQLAHSRGKPADFYNTDISGVLENGAWRDPHVNVGIKTTKFNGIWFDVPRQQFSLSNYHVQVKIGGGSFHLFSFFKQLSVFKDKILKAGLEGDYLTVEESEQIWNDLPTFRPLPAYIAGFAERDRDYSALDYVGRLALKHYTIYEFRGLLSGNWEEQIRKAAKVPTSGQVKFESIGRFSGTDRFLFNTGSIHRTREEWQQLAASL